MNPKSIRNLGLALIFLVILIVGRTLMEKRSLETLNLFQEKVSGVRKDDIDYVKIGKGKETLVLVKEDNKWQFGDKESTESAQEDKVKKLLDEIFDASVVELVAKTNARHKELELDGEQAIKFDLKYLDELKLTFLIGKNSFSGTYLRFADKDEVYLHKGFVTRVTLDKDDWVEKKEDPEPSL